MAKKAVTKAVAKAKPKAKPKHKAKPKPKAKPPNVFILKRFNGDEIYPLKKAEMKAIACFAGGIRLWFEAKAESQAIQTCPDTANMGMRPSASVGVHMASLNADELEGQEFQMVGTKTDDEDSATALLYYCEHQPLRNNVFKILSRTKNVFHVQWTATTCDVNYYDGSKPLTTVVIEGDFTFKEFAKWRSSE